MRFMFFDQVLSVEKAKRIVATKTVTMDGAYFASHCVKRPVMPATLVIEAIAQTAGWLNFITHDESIRMVVALVENVKFLKPVHPGDTLTLEVNVAFLHPGGLTVRGEARIGTEVIATVERMVFANQAVARELLNPQELAHYDYVKAGARIPAAVK